MGATVAVPCDPQLVAAGVVRHRRVVGPRCRSPGALAGHVDVAGRGVERDAVDIIDADGPLVSGDPQLIAAGIVGHRRVPPRVALAGHVHGPGIGIDGDGPGAIIAMAGSIVPGHPQLIAARIVRHRRVVITRRRSAVAGAGHVHGAGIGVDGDRGRVSRMGGAVVPPVVPRHPELVAQGTVGHGRILGACIRPTRRAVAGHVHGAGVRIHCDRGGPLVAPAPVRRRTLLVGPVVPGHPQLNAIGVVRHGGVVIARRGSAIADSAIAAARHVYVAGGGVSRDAAGFVVGWAWKDASWAAVPRDPSLDDLSGRYRGKQGDNAHHSHDEAEHQRQTAAFHADHLSCLPPCVMPVLYQPAMRASPPPNSRSISARVDGEVGPEVAKSGLKGARFSRRVSDYRVVIWRV